MTAPNQPIKRNVCRTQYSMVTLVDGTRVTSDSEPWRFECEARYVLDMPTKEARQAFLRGEFNTKTQLRTGGLAKIRGEDYVKQLEDKILELWRARRSAA